MGTLWYGGTIYTLVNEGHKVEALFTEEGRIVGIGSLEELEKQFGDRTDLRIDMRGNTMLPGLVDSHIHIIGHGERLIRLDLSQCTSKQEVLEKVKAYVLGVKKGEWVVGEGWNENLWSKPETIHKKELDAITPNHPVILKRICRHALAANSLALNAATLTEETACPTSGVIEVDEEGLTGILKDSAMELLLSIMPAPSEEYLLRAMKAAIADLYSLGITGVHTEDLNYYGGFSKTLNTFRRAIINDGLKFRSHLLVHHGVMEDLKSQGGSFHEGNEWIEFGAIKIFSDGALGGRTALLSEPYSDFPGTSGVAIFSRDELSNLVGKARIQNMPVAIHAIGDLAFEYCLDALEENPLKGAGRDRLIHAQILREDLVERAKRLPLVLDLQPVFLASDFPWVIERIGKERLRYSYAWKTLLDAGIPCSGGSDAPIEYPNPFHAFHAAVNRTRLDDRDGEAYALDQALSVYEAVSLYTKGSAYAACHEQDRGQLIEGYLADFTIIDQDIFTSNPNTLADTKAVMTVIGGEVVYEQK